MDTMTLLFAGISAAVVASVLIAGSMVREARDEDSVDLDERMLDIELEVFPDSLTSKWVQA